MLPLRDENPTDITPVLTFGLIGANVVVWLLLQGAGSGGAFMQSLCDWATIPGEVTGAIPDGEVIRRGGWRCRAGGATDVTLLTSMFMHGGWGHLIMNMWFLWVFGNNIEDAMGHGRYLVFYLVAGVLAAAAHIVTAPDSPVPTVGASGAISGVMGAYVVLYPRVRVDTLVFVVFFIRVLPLPAWAMLGYWILLQFLQGVATAGAAGATGGVAVWAHVGGFVVGVVLAKLFARANGGDGGLGVRVVEG